MDLQELFPVWPTPPVRAAVTPVTAPRPSNHLERTANPLRPQQLDAMIGQTRTRAFLRRVLDAVSDRGDVLDHVLLVGPSGVGKSTIANVVANELAVDCYQVEAPVSHDTLLELRTRC
jgi:Holliday junction DNA helicase RuvB